MADEREYVSKDQYEGRNKLVDERCGRDKERLEAQEKAMQEVRDLTVQMGEILKKYDASISSHEKRIADLEHQPADQYSKIKLTLVSALAGGIIVYILNAILPSVKP
jgi:uncharacterized coiled-coil protein SlyX